MRGGQHVVGGEQRMGDGEQVGKRREQSRAGGVDRERGVARKAADVDGSAGSPDVEQAVEHDLVRGREVVGAVQRAGES